jgi:hypothetical protein
MAKKEGIEKDRILPCGRKGGISKMKSSFPWGSRFYCELNRTIGRSEIVFTCHHELFNVN